MDAPVVWLTGLPAAGKSTIAALVAADLRRTGVDVELLDGDAVRRTLSPDLGFSRRDRDENVRRVAAAAAEARRHGALVVVAMVSPYRRARADARRLLGEPFVEVHVTASLETCAARDPKGLYARARAGEIDGFTGVSDPYEPPEDPELVVDTEVDPPAASAGTVLARLQRVRAVAAG
jgi:adenylyl-sulfate kinase